MDGKKTTGAKVMATSVAKKHGQIRGEGNSTGCKFNGKIWAASKSPWQHWWQRKGKLALWAKSNSNIGGKAMAKIVARARDWTRKWEIMGNHWEMQKAHCIST